MTTKLRPNCFAPTRPDFGHFCSLWPPLTIGRINWLRSARKLSRAAPLMQSIGGGGGGEQLFLCCSPLVSRN